MEVRPPVEKGLDEHLVAVCLLPESLGAVYGQQDVHQLLVGRHLIGRGLDVLLPVEKGLDEHLVAVCLLPESLGAVYGQNVGVTPLVGHSRSLLPPSGKRCCSLGCCLSRPSHCWAAHPEGESNFSFSLSCRLCQHC